MIFVHLARDNGTVIEVVGLGIVCAHVKAVMLDAMHSR
jgi:hypothetical protein